MALVYRSQLDQPCLLVSHRIEWKHLSHPAMPRSHPISLILMFITSHFLSSLASSTYYVACRVLGTLEATNITGMPVLTLRLSPPNQRDAVRTLSAAELSSGAGGGGEVLGGQVWRWADVVTSQCQVSAQLNHSHLRAFPPPFLMTRMPSIFQLGSCFSLC